MIRERGEKTVEVAKINPYVRYAKAHHNTAHGTYVSICYDCRLFYFHQASGSITVCGTKHILTNGSVAFLPPGSRYVFAVDEIAPTGAVLVLNFDLVDTFSHLENPLGTAKEQNYSPELVIRYEMPTELSDVVFDNLSHLYDPLLACTEEFLTQALYFRENTSAVLKQCLIGMLRSSSAKMMPESLRRVMNYMAEHYADGELSIKKIAAACNYHPNYVTQLFRRTMGTTPHTYLYQYRIRMAQNLLRTTGLDIGTIAWKTGFNSSSYFIKVFSAYVGVTPHKYRRIHITRIY